MIRMLHSVIGHEHFQEGLQVYMQRHQYSNTETFHLWRAWEEVSGKPISKIMSSWTEQMGFPLLSIDSREVNPDGSVVLNLSQKWFLADGSEPDDRLWTIPISFQAESQAATEPVLMSERTMALTVPATNGKPPAWIKLNAGQHVNMRVAYDDITGLSEAVSSMALGPEDRAGILLDAFALTKANHPSMDPAKLLQLTSAYRNETHATVWEGIEKVLVSVDKALLAAGESTKALRDSFVKWASDLVHPAATVIGWEDRPTDGHLDRLMRSTLISLQSRFCLEYPDVVSRAHELWDLFFETVEGHPDHQIPADYKVPIFKIVLSTTQGTRAFDTLLAHLETLTANAERKHVYAAIGACADIKLKRRVLEWAVSGAIKLQDFFYPMGSVSGSSPEGLNLAWSFYQENFEHIKSMLSKASPSLMDAAIVYSVSGYCTNDKANEIEGFFQSHPLPASARRISQTVEGIRTSAIFLAAILASDLTHVLQN